MSSRYYMIFIFWIPFLGYADDLDVLEERLAIIDKDLSVLSKMSIQSGVGSIGDKSMSHDHPKNSEWFQVTFDELSDIDQVVLVPNLWRDSSTSVVSDGFPEEFHILVGYRDDGQGEVVAKYTAKDQHAQRTAPLCIDVIRKQVKWVRVVATHLSPRVWDGAYLFQLAEILVFRGEENIALHQKVSVSSEEELPDHGARKREFLVDGNVPYQMNTGDGQTSKAYRLRVIEPRAVHLTVDLEEATLVNALLFHTLELSDSIPQAVRSDTGLPRQFQLLGSNDPEFEKSEQLAEFRFRSVYDCAPMIQLMFPEVSYRYFRLALIELDYAGDYEVHDPFHFFSCSELELLSAGRNILGGKVFETNYRPIESLGEIEVFPRANLTDGKNMFGSILTMREWLRQLAVRYDLERERPVIVDQINVAFAIQKRNLTWLKIAFIVLLLILGAGFVVSRMIQAKRITDIRMRFAADLHDELGANLHAISILTDIADDCMKEGDGDHLAKSIKKIRATTQRTADSVKNSIHRQEGRPYINSIKSDMLRIANRMFPHTQYVIEVEGEELISALSDTMRHDLFLFYKECLANISKHATAQSFSVRLEATGERILLCVSDNGEGDLLKRVPHSLKRRARYLKGKVHYESSVQAPSGVTVTLIFKAPKNRNIN